LDIPISSAIKKAGGIYVVIAVFPKTFREAEQFKERTRRMGDKGNIPLFFAKRLNAKLQKLFCNSV
jgi:hypothetical protein